MKRLFSRVLADRDYTLAFHRSIILDEVMPLIVEEMVRETVKEIEV